MNRAVTNDASRVTARASGSTPLPSPIDAAKAIQLAFRRCRKAPRPVTDSTMENLYRRLDVGAVKLPEHMAAIALDAYRRGQSRAEVEAPAYAYLAYVAELYQEPAPDPRHLDTLSLAETMAQGPADVAQMSRDLDGPGLLETERKLAVHRDAIDKLLAAVRRRLHTPNRSA